MLLHSSRALLMAAKPLPWMSRNLAALTAVFGEIQKAIQAAAGKAGFLPIR